MRREGPDYVIEVHGAIAIANTIAYLSETVDPISIFLSLTRQDLTRQALRFVFLGEGDTGLLVYAILLRYWEWTAAGRRPGAGHILTVAAGRDDTVQGATLLAAYSLGIGVPFLAAALFARPFLDLMRRYRPYLRRVEQVIGVLLVATGALIVAGSFDDIGYWLLQAFPALGRIG